MKSTKTLICKAALVAATLLTQYVRAEGPVMAGPRALEESPWLARPAPYERRDPSRVPAGITNNRALVASPRILEEYPQLARVRYPARSNAESIELAQVLRNAALANSPREREDFPCLERGGAITSARKNSPSPKLLGNVSARH